MTDEPLTIASWGYAMEWEQLKRHMLSRNSREAYTPEGHNLRQQAWKRWGHKCPCCGVPMHNRKGRSMETPTKMTAGHDGMRGVTPRWRWIYICLRCNQQQGELRFRGWAYVLRKNGDRRADRVLEVAEFMDREAGVHLTPVRTRVTRDVE